MRTGRRCTPTSSGSTPPPASDTVTLARSTKLQSDPLPPAIKSEEQEAMHLAQLLSKSTTLQIASHTSQQSLVNGGRELPGVSLTLQSWMQRMSTMQTSPQILTPKHPLTLPTSTPTEQIPRPLLPLVLPITKRRNSPGLLPSL